MARRKSGTGFSKDLVISLGLAIMVGLVFVGTYLVKKPKQIKPSEASVGGKSYIGNCSDVSWDPARTYTLSLDDSRTGVLTNQYLSSGPLFDYNIVQGVGLNKISVDNPLNQGNGYASTISSDEQPFSNPIASPTESSMILLFPSPVQAVQFQMQYGEPFDASDINRPYTPWGVELRIYVAGMSTPVLVHEWDLTISDFTMITDVLKNVCFNATWNKLISRIDILVPADKHDRIESYPPDKISFDNFKIQVPKGWSPATGGTITPTPSNDPGTCSCLPSGRLKTDNCNYSYNYAPVCYSTGCMCVR